MKVKIKFDDGVVSLPKSVLKYMKQASENDAKVIFAICAQDSFEVKDVADNLGISEEEVMLSLGFWRGTGIIDVISKTKKTNSNPPKVESFDYTAVDIDAIMKDSPEIEVLFLKCEEVLKKVFSSGDKRVIIYLYSHLELTIDYIIMLCQHCMSLGHSSTRYIEKVATDLYDNGVNTSEKLNEYLIKKNKGKTIEGYIRTLYGLGDRALTQNEEKIISSWIDKEYTKDQLKDAYETMMNCIDKPKLSYMDKVLSSPIEEKQKKPRKKQRNKVNDDSSFDIDDFFENNIKNSMND